MKRSKGFTLVELLIVMAVIAVLIAVAIPSFRGMQTEARRTRVQSDLHVIKLSLEAYYKNTGAYPAVAGYQATLRANNTIMDRELDDPFAAASTPYVYRLGELATPATARYYLVYSVGPSGSGSATVDNTTGVVTPAGDVIWDGNGRL